MHCLHLRQVFLDNLLDNVQINIEVFVDDPVSHPDDLRPRHIRILSAQLVREVAARFTDDFQLTHNTILKEIVLQKLLSCYIGQVSFYAMNSVQDVPQVDGIILRHTEPPVPCPLGVEHKG